MKHNYLFALQNKIGLAMLKRYKAVAKYVYEECDGGEEMQALIKAFETVETYIKENA